MEGIELRELFGCRELDVRFARGGICVHVCVGVCRCVNCTRGNSSGRLSYATVGNKYVFKFSRGVALRTSLRLPSVVIIDGFTMLTCLTIMNNDFLRSRISPIEVNEIIYLRDGLRNFARSGKHRRHILFEYLWIITYNLLDDCNCNTIFLLREARRMVEKFP